MVRKKKVQIGWWVPAESVQSFREGVIRKRGQKWAYFGEELGRAMDAYLDNHLSHAEPCTRTHKQLKKTSKSRLYKLVGYLRANYQRELTDKSIYEALDGVFGADDFRTFTKYRDLLLDRKLIRRDRRAPPLDFVITTPSGKKRTIPAFIYKWEKGGNQ